MPKSHGSHERTGRLGCNIERGSHVGFSDTLRCDGALTDRLASTQLERTAEKARPLNRRPFGGRLGSLLPKARTCTLGPMSYHDIITIEPDKRGGKPCIRGMRITVYDVLEYLASGMTQEQIIEDFPELTTEDIRACLEFAADRERKLVSIPLA